jgi:glutaredoxin 2
MSIRGGSLSFGHWGMLEAGTRYKRTQAIMKHIQNLPKVNNLPTGSSQANDNGSWEQLGIPLARVLSNCAEAMWRQQLIEKAEAISQRSDIGAGEQVRLLAEAIHAGAVK